MRVESDNPDVAARSSSFSSPLSHNDLTKRIPLFFREHTFLLTLLLLVLAIVPRIVLALRLDMVTDEVVYIRGGEIYQPLLSGFRFRDAGWLFNYEHPPLVKILIGFTLALNRMIGSPLTELLAARLPAIFMGTLLVLSLYWLGRAPFGHLVAFGAALCLAFSPWLVYFSALAYLDMTMVSFITMAYLVLWHATKQPRFYPWVALLVALGAASKYTAVLVVPGLLLFTAYFFLLIRPRLPADKKFALPWGWWLLAILGAPLLFFLVDPAIWTSPITLLIHSFRFEWEHSIHGHLTFIAGQYLWHVPRWAILYILAAKLSAFITVPALGFVLFALVRIIRFHCSKKTTISVSEVTRLAFVVIWLLSLLGTFSLLNIVVGTHYHLPLAAPVVVAGMMGWAIFLRYAARILSGKREKNKDKQRLAIATHPGRFLPAFVSARLVVGLLLLLVTLPHLIGLVSIPQAEGYTSEFFAGENTALQVAYPGYRDALIWLADHTHGTAKVGIGSVPGNLQIGSGSASWYYYNRDLARRFQMTEAHADDKDFPYDYLIWPMHLIQRGLVMPAPWNVHIVHVIKGGETIYCYIAARDQSLIQDKPL